MCHSTMCGGNALCHIECPQEQKMHALGCVCLCRTMHKVSTCSKMGSNMFQKVFFAAMFLTQDFGFRGLPETILGFEACPKPCSVHTAKRSGTPGAGVPVSTGPEFPSWGTLMAARSAIGWIPPCSVGCLRRSVGGIGTFQDRTSNKSCTARAWKPTSWIL